MSGLDGWTKVGDQVGATGRWVLYRHKGVQFASVEVLQDLPPDAGTMAERLYTKKAEDIRRGGLWLVDPSGRVCGVTFIRP